MAPAINKSEAKAKEPASAKAKAKLKIKLNVKAPTKGETRVSEETDVKVPKTSDEEFLLTLLNPLKVDYQAAADTLGINTPACRMRFIRLQQKYGFKKKGAKGTPRKKTATEKKTAPANESDGTAEETTVEEATEN
ncbi:hypothetical protein N7471_012491 [Penicillium samsonianum]|uniref:uncharacterized protein n=1 Tax=Penicillium samsonianum TaxID=1882272 RepID=UPI002546E153|nr:uncharacterized protein N7471_012491 [Penicillium samsonianum]KAJ6125174.1 hypothetical protein N7471_012491 [Penicillium samsonianum]